MERTATLYKIRRKMQALAHLVIPNEMMSKAYFRIVMKKKLDLVNPKSFNEKIQWMKLYYYPYNSTVIQCTDKYAVRKYIEDKGYKDKLVPLIGSWLNANQIDWNQLPNQFVLKCNHGCAYNIICNDKSEADKTAIVKQLNAWMKEDFGSYNIEIHYSRVLPHRIICEEYLGECITDYKFFCFGGKAKYIYVSKDLVHDRQAEIGFFFLNGEKMPLHRDDYKDIKSIELPPFFSEMKIIADDLSKGFPFVRVDFFLANDTFYFAELTFTPGAGMMPFNPEEYDQKWGELIELPRKQSKGEI